VWYLAPMMGSKSPHCRERDEIDRETNTGRGENGKWKREREKRKVRKC
jgi:hypothetical protein